MQHFTNGAPYVTCAYLQHRVTCAYLQHRVLGEVRALKWNTEGHWSPRDRELADDVWEALSREEGRGAERQAITLHTPEGSSLETRDGHSFPQNNS